ncbi:hypothetical protein MMC17_003809 [Xylographa soralifera]|nr:hypothetical protein [Xylographa soralifera]
MKEMAPSDRFDYNAEQYDEDFEELEDQSSPEEDSETRFSPSNGPIERSADEESVEILIGFDESEHYSFAAKFFMSMLLGETPSQRKIGKVGEARYPLCLDDDTTDNAAGYKFGEINHLQRYMKNLFHFDWMTFIRLIHQRAKSLVTGTVVCTTSRAQHRMTRLSDPET